MTFVGPKVRRMAFVAPASVTCVVAAIQSVKGPCIAIWPKHINLAQTHQFSPNTSIWPKHINLNTFASLQDREVNHLSVFRCLRGCSQAVVRTLPWS